MSDALRHFPVKRQGRAISYSVVTKACHRASSLLRSVICIIIIIIVIISIISIVGLDSAVGIATRYGLDGPGFKSR